jgi:hypothetical protein
MLAIMHQSVRGVMPGLIPASARYVSTGTDLAFLLGSTTARVKQKGIKV